MKRALTLSLFLLASLAAQPPGTRTQLDLSGPWLFFPDYSARGAAIGWQEPALNESSWDRVDVPHIWNLEPRYDHTGQAWYRRRFTAPALPDGAHARLRFGAVFYKCQVWLNGTLLGGHEGGYTAFDLDTKGALKPNQENVIAVMVDNSWNSETIPGSRTGNLPSHLTYPWWNFGGIKKPVYLEVAPATYIENQKVVAVPDLTAGSAAVSVSVWARNTSPKPERRKVRVRVRRPGAWEPTASAESELLVPAGSVARAELRLQLPAPVALWDVDAPNLYESLVQIGDASAADSHLTRFGIRQIEIRDAKLLLNGEPVAFGGANRSADHPKFGSMETKEVIEQDMSMMKSANMGLARILHYPPSQTLLDWCDAHGFLLIAEAGNWGLTPEQMDSPKLRSVWQSQAREMIEQSWNHPSIIGWSVGNEYASDTPAGVRWTRDMIAFTRQLDASRLHTFVSLGGMIFSKVKPEENSFHYADILCPNIYGNGNLGRSMETLHAIWPGKPVLITEFGWREDTATSEAGRARDFREALKILRNYPFVIGASVWSWNDYRSRHYGTNSDGYRHWGLVAADRSPRESYFALREEFSPLVPGTLNIDRKPQGLSANFALKTSIEGRVGFPSRTVRGHLVAAVLLDHAGKVTREVVQPLAMVRPGDRVDVVIPLSPFDLSAATRLRFEIRQPDGLVGLVKELLLRPIP
jgi:beta-glucuronidase